MEYTQEVVFWVWNWIKSESKREHPNYILGTCG